jgi:hypothetical protein
MPDDDLLPKVLDVLQGQGRGLDRLLPGSSDRFATSLAPAYRNLQAALGRIGAETSETMRGPDHRTAAWGLLWDACNSLLAAFTLLQRGYETESLAVSRVVLERVACAIVLFDNPGILPRFKAGKMTDLSTRAIGPAGQVIRGFSRVYGDLSRLGVHVGRDNIGVAVIRVAKAEGSRPLNLAIGGKFPTEALEIGAWRSFVDELCRISEKILVVAPEQVFFNKTRRRATL